MQVLFVDDDERLLRGLKRMLRGHVDWNIRFALGGAEALEKLEQRPADVIVADMRMPGMDGSQLLARVQELYPETVRIVLSGHSDQQAVLHMVRPAHQFLSKPCEAETLISTLERVHTLRSVFTNERLRSIITRIDSLPVLPSVYHGLVAELEREDGSLERAGSILAKDVGLSAGVLKAVNSAFFGLSRKVNTPEQAAALLGIDVLKGLVISEGLFSTYRPAERIAFSLDKLWSHSLRVAGFARVICSLQGGDNELCQEAFLCGMLHDLGKIALADRLPDEYADVLSATRANNVTVREAELERLQADHAELGGYLLGLWGFSEPVVRAVGGHHAPSAGASGNAPLLTCVHAANYIDHLLVVFNKDYAEHPLDVEYVAVSGVIDKLPGWVEACHNMLELEDA